MSSPAKASGARSPAARDSTRVLLVTHYFPAHGGGIEKVALEVARRLVDTGEFRISWVSSNTVAPPQISGITSISANTWNWIERRFGVPIPLWSARVLATLWRETRSADVVHIHDVLYPGNIVAACFALLHRRPLVVTQHIGPVAYENRALRFIVAVANRWVAAPLLRRATRVLFISAAVQTYFDARTRWKNPPLLVPNGVDTELFAPPSGTQRAAARAGLKADDARRVLLFVGRFVEKKGLHLLERLARQMPEADWIFAGHGPLDPAEWRLPNVQVFRGLAGSGIRDLIWGADLLVSPSTPGSEGFPLVVQEALACGLPALVSADIADGYPPSRDYLLLEAVDRDAEQRWLARLRDIAAGNAGSVPDQALVHFAREHWSWDRAVAEYRAVLAPC